jgi:hypothetical protein
MPSYSGSRRLLYTPQYVAGFARALREARADLDAMHAKHLYEMDELRRELDEVRDAFNQLRAAVTRREQADVEVCALYRERDIVRAKAAERDPTTLLH